MQSMSTSRARGFTLVEIMIIAPVVILVIGGFIGLIIVMTGDVLRMSENNRTVYNAQTALDIIEQDVKLTTEFRATSYTPIVPYGRNETTATYDVVANLSPNLTDDFPSFILRTSATDKSPLDTTRQILHRANSPYACANSLVNQNDPYLVDVVYYVTYDLLPATLPPNGSMTLWRRVLTDSSGSNTYCGATAPWQQPTCSVASIGAVCKIEDTMLLKDITTFTRLFLAAPSSGSGINADADNPNSSTGTNARTLRLGIDITKTVAGRQATTHVDLNASRLNSPPN